MKTEHFEFENSSNNHSNVIGDNTRQNFRVLSPDFIFCYVEIIIMMIRYNIIIISAIIIIMIIIIIASIVFVITIIKSQMKLTVAYYYQNCYYYQLSLIKQFWKSILSIIIRFGNVYY